MKLIEGSHYMRRLDQYSPQPHPSKEFVDWLLRSAPSDSEDGEVRRRITRKNTRKGIRLDKFMKHFKVQHREEPHNEGRTLFYYPGFSRAGAGPKTVVAALPRSPDLELEPIGLEEPQTVAARHEQQPQRPAAETDIPFVTAEVCSDMGQPYWRTFTMQMDIVIKANCTA